MEDLPIAVVLDGALGNEVAAWVETRGWQVVDADGPLRPAVVLAAVPLPGLPTVVLVDGAPTVAEVRDALQAGALDVLAWPEDRERLLGIPAILRPVAAASGGARCIAVAGVAGGVGTSTVALAVGGLLAWSGRRTLVVGDQDLLVLCAADPWTGPGAEEVALLDARGAAAEVSSLARDVPGVPRLQVLGGGGGAVHGPGDWPFDAVVLDLRTNGFDRAEILCGRPDVHLAAAATASGAVLLIGDGPLDGAQVRTALRRRPAGRLATSARVARAGAVGRVPAGLPGTWLRDLRRGLLRALR